MISSLNRSLPAGVLFHNFIWKFHRPLQFVLVLRLHALYFDGRLVFFIEDSRSFVKYIHE